MAKPKKSGKNPSQKQKQTQIVNINLGTKVKGKGKKKVKKGEPKKKKGETQIIPAFNPPPIINYPPQFVAPNNPNWFKPPSVSQSNKEYAVLPEGETAGLLNLNPVNPIPLKIGRGEERVTLPIREPNLVDLAKPVGEGSIVEDPFKEEDDISVLTEAPEFQNLPVEAEGQVLDLPPAEASFLLENKEPLFDPFNLPVPATSGRSLAESVAEPPSEAGFSYPYSESGLSLPQSRFLGGSNVVFLPPIKTAEKSEVPFSPLASSGLTLPIPFDQLPIAKAEKSKRVEGFTGNLVVVQPPEEEIQRSASGRKVRGPNLSEAQRTEKKRAESERKRAETKAKKDREKGASLYQFLPTETNERVVGIPLQFGLKGPEPFKYSAPLSESEGQYEFIGGPPPQTEKQQGGLERRRGGGVLTGTEASFLAEPPPFLAPSLTFIA